METILDPRVWAHLAVEIPSVFTLLSEGDPESPHQAGHPSRLEEWGELGRFLGCGQLFSPPLSRGMSS